MPFIVPARRHRVYFYPLSRSGGDHVLGIIEYNPDAIPPDAARRSVPLTILGKFLHKPSRPVSACLPATTMLTASFPCIVLHRRNLACIGCGCPRGGGMSQTQQHQPSHPSNRTLSSPRFSSFSTHNPPLSPVQQQQQPQYIYSQPSPQPAYVSSPTQPPKSAHPLLTPSGRAFAVGGKVQNISSDPLSPCIMYWPDNEPLPEQGQIRPSGLVGVPVSLLFPDKWSMTKIPCLNA